MIEKISPDPCTITIPPLKPCTTRTISQPLGVSIIEDDTRARVLHKGTVLKGMVRVVAEGTASVRAIVGQVGESATEHAIVTGAAILGMTWCLLMAVGTLIIGAVNTKMPKGVALKTMSLRSRCWFWAQMGIARCNSGEV